MRLALLALAVMLATGCTRRQQDFAWFAAAVAVEVANAANASGPESSSGVAVAAPDPESYPPPTPADLQRAYAVAMELTRTAAHDARADDCDAVMRASDHVRVIDPAVFANVFLRDEPIQRCLAITPNLTSDVTVIQ